MYNQYGIIALFEGCGWILLERTNGKQYTYTCMYQTDQNKDPEAKSGCTCIFITVICFMYMQLVGLSLLELVVLEIASTYKTMYFKKIQLVASPVFSPGFCLGESQGPLC